MDGTWGGATEGTSGGATAETLQTVSKEVSLQTASSRNGARRSSKWDRALREEAMADEFPFVTAPREKTQLGQ